MTHGIFNKKALKWGFLGRGQKASDTERLNILPTVAQYVEQSGFKTWWSSCRVCITKLTFKTLLLLLLIDNTKTRSLKWIIKYAKHIGLIKEKKAKIYRTWLRMKRHRTRDTETKNYKTWNFILNNFKNRESYSVARKTKVNQRRSRPLK